jgi:hypothetical protein
MAKIDCGNKIQSLSIDVRNVLAYYFSIKEEVDGNSWYHDIKWFIQHQEYPREASSTYMKTLQRLALNYYLDGEIMYKRSLDGTLLRYLDGMEVKKAFQEVHEGVCATHASRHMTTIQIKKIRVLLVDLEEGFHRICQEMP